MKLLVTIKNCKFTSANKQQKNIHSAGLLTICNQIIDLPRGIGYSRLHPKMLTAFLNALFIRIVVIFMLSIFTVHDLRITRVG